MKNESGNLKNRVLTTLKNQYIFEKLLWGTEHDLPVLLRDLSKKYNPSAGQRIVFPLKQAVKKDLFVERDRRFRESLLSIKKWPPKKLDEFLRDIDHLLASSELGHEWRLPLITLTLQGWFFPPTRNMDIKNAGEGNKKRVALTLNPDTSIEDVKGAWAEIKKRQAKLWPEFKKTNFTKKSFKHIGIFAKDLEERFLKKEEWDSVSVKNYLKKDLDIVGVVWRNEKDISIEADKKRLANLRQIRHRRSKSR